MNLRLIVTILVIAVAPVCAQAQKPTPAKVTKADAQKVSKKFDRAEDALTPALRGASHSRRGRCPRPPAQTIHGARIAHFPVPLALRPGWQPHRLCGGPTHSHGRSGYWNAVVFPRLAVGGGA